MDTRGRNISSPNDLRIRRQLKPNAEGKKMSEWNKVLDEAIRRTLFREPTLKDYTLFTREIGKGANNYQLFYNGIYIGYVSKGGNMIFYPRND